MPKLCIATIEYMTRHKIENLLLFSLKCHPIYPGIQKDPSTGAQTQDYLRYSNGCCGNSWNSKLAILE